MRMLAVPLAFLLSFCLYLPLPRADGLMTRGIGRLFDGFLRLGNRGAHTLRHERALALFVLLFAVLCQLLGGWHPAASGLLMAPLFFAVAQLPDAVRAKEELDSGAFSRDTEGYEARVRSVCAGLGPAFTDGVCAPLLLMALGAPLHLSCLTGGAYLALRALAGQHRPAQHALVVLRRPVWAVMRAMLLLCSCVVGRNPLRAHGSEPRALLLSILGIAGDETDTHAPVAGDIAQAVFLCCFASALLCAMLTVALLPLCR